MSEFEQIMMAFKKQKLSFTDNAIFDGIVERYNQRSSITPKQALWFLKKLIKSQIEVPVEYADYIEKPSLLEQKHAHAECMEMIAKLSPAYHDEEQQVERFNNMFKPVEPEAELNQPAASIPQQRVDAIRLKAIKRSLEDAIMHIDNLL